MVEVDGDDEPPTEAECLQKGRRFGVGVELRQGKAPVDRLAGKPGRAKNGEGKRMRAKVACRDMHENIEEVDAMRGQLEEVLYVARGTYYQY